MKVPRDLSGRDVVKVLCSDWDYRKVNQVGSHIALETESPSHHRICIPDHRTLKVGTLSGIIAAVARHKGVSREAFLKSLL